MIINSCNLGYATFYSLFFVDNNGIETNKIYNQIKTIANGDFVIFSGIPFRSKDMELKMKDGTKKILHGNGSVKCDFSEEGMPEISVEFTDVKKK